MRTLTSTLTAAQQSSSQKPCPKIILTSGANSYTYESDRILSITHTENENSCQAIVELQNADGALTPISLKGYDAIISHGLETKAGKEYSTATPFKVIGQKFTSSEGILRCTLQLAGLPDLLIEDKASEDYKHSVSSTKTVKDLVTEIADGQAVPEDLTVSQTQGTSQQHLYNGSVVAVGQRLAISKIVKSLSFKLKRYGYPSGDVYFKIYDPDTEAELGSKKLSAATAVSDTVATWYEATFDTAVTLDQEVIIAVLFSGGDASNYVIVYYKNQNLFSSENMVNYETGFIDHFDYECAYKYKYTYSGISVYSECTSYDAVYDSEDSLIETYCPADSFTIRENEDRLSVIDKLLFYTGCQRIFKADGKMHVFVPTTTGTSYDSEYSLTSGHPFFAKTLRDALVIPNKVVVRSLKDADTQYSGSAISTASYTLLPKIDYQRAAVTSGSQADAIAAAMISRLEISAQQGGATVPLNCGSELYDYIKVTDTRESDYRVGNLGSIVRTFKNYPGRPPEYNMTFYFGQVALKSVPGTKSSGLISMGIMPRESDGAIPWDEMWKWMQCKEYDLRNIMIALGFIEAETPADEQIKNELVGFLKNVVEDSTPELGGDLNANNKKITSLAAPASNNDAATKSYADAKLANLVEDITPQLGGDLDTNTHDIISTNDNISIDGYSGIMLKANGTWMVSIGSNVSIKALTTTPSNVTSSRAFNTTYTNNTNYPLFVAVVFNVSSTSYGQVYLKIHASADPPTTIIDGIFHYSPATDILTLSVKGLVPIGWKYRVVKYGDCTIDTWTETALGS